MFRFFLLFVCCFLVSADLFAADLRLAPHKAVYDLSLKKAESVSGLLGADGTLTYQLTEDCEGWIVEVATDLTLRHKKRGKEVHIWRYSTYEKKDGSFFAFDSRAHGGDGRVGATYAGRTEPSKRQKILYSTPEGLEKTLPDGTLFPTAHVLALTQAALSGEKMLTETLYDGNDGDALARVNAVIAPQEAGDRLTEVAHPLLKTPFWRVSMAFFPYGSKESLPIYEVTALHHANGVSHHLVQDYGHFALEGRLSALEEKPLAVCKAEK